MKAMVLTGALLVAMTGGAWATLDAPPDPAAAAPSCPSETSVREAATKIDAQEVIPLRSHSGHRFLMLVLRNGHGLVVASSPQGCFDAMMAIPREAVARVLSLSQPT